MRVGEQMRRKNLCCEFPFLRKEPKRKHPPGTAIGNRFFLCSSSARTITGFEHAVDFLEGLLLLGYLIVAANGTQDGFEDDEIEMLI